MQLVDPTLNPEIITQLVAAGSGAQWVVLAGFVLTVLVWVARRMLGEKKLPSAAIPVLNSVTALVLAVADLLIRGRPWYEALGTGALVASAAGGFWSMLGKHILPLPDSSSDSKE